MRSAQRTKIELVTQWGGVCRRCGYNKCHRALQFHHKDSSEKDAWSRGRGHTSLDEVREYPERFELVCANCHFEIHDEIDKANAQYANCAHCQEPFKIEPRRVADGRNKYCCKACEIAGRGIRSTPIEERFWKHVEKTIDCWLWTAQRDRQGYGRINCERSPVLTHRLSWEIHNGPVPEGKFVLHSCSNHACVNPDHLYLGTYTDKVAQSMSNGRTNRGERSSAAKLTKEIVTEIRRRYNAGGISQPQLAQEYNVSQFTIRDIVQRITWKHIP